MFHFLCLHVEATGEKIAQLNQMDGNGINEKIFSHPLKSARLNCIC